MMKKNLKRFLSIFMAVLTTAVNIMSPMTVQAAEKKVKVTKQTRYAYEDYGMGSYVTYKYHVEYGDVSATAYCIEPSKDSPESGEMTITKLKDSKLLAKVCYYGTKAAGDEGFFAEKYPDFSAGKRFIITHLAASYAAGSDDAFSGANDTAKKLAKELYEYCKDQPAIPEVDMEFSDDDVTAYIDGNSQRTKVITFKADELQTITMKLPDGVKLHNVTTDKTSKAGADVEICGGTKFYLSAPLTQAEDVKATWSSKMKGSITKDYSAYKLTTGKGDQNLAMVFGEGVDDEKYVTFSVSWVQKSTVEITKIDETTRETLAGSVYGVYADADCKELITTMPVTNEDGASSVTIYKTQDTVYLKEITAPNGYTLNDAVYPVNLVGGDTVEKEVTDKVQYGSLTVYKSGEVLTGASVTDSGVTFHYENRKLKGAVYNIYAAENIISPTGRIVYAKGTLIAENLTTGDDGSVTLNNLYLGTYTVKEVKAPNGYVNHGESKNVTIAYAGQKEETAFASVSFENDRQKAEVEVVKIDKDTENPLAGGEFGIYAGCDIKNADGTVVVKKDTLLENVVTGISGKVAAKTDLPLGFDYYIKETKAPKGYLRNSDDIYFFHFSYKGENESVAKFSHTFTDERVKGSIQLIKKDAETGIAQGDATLEKAVYGLYARKDIVHPDNATGVLYKAGTQVATLTTDKDGKASVQDLYLGSYYVKEITPSEGYLLDEKEYDMVFEAEDDVTKVIEKTCTSLEDVIKQPFQLIKAANNGNTDAALLEKAGFMAYLESSLSKKEDGGYDFDSAVPVVLTEDGGTELFTDKNGYAVSIPLPYGTYIVRETTTPHNYKPVNDFVVTISSNNPITPQTWRVLLDEEFEAKLKIIKKDDETKKSVLIPGTEFKVYDLDNNRYVEQVTTYPITKVHKSFFTDEEGYLILPQTLKIGRYRVEEVTAPEGYSINENYVEIQVDADTMYQEDEVSKDIIIEVVYENHPVKGELTIVKKGEVVKDFNGVFHYEEKNLSGAVYKVYAAEDIYTADNQKDAEGNRILEYKKGEFVAEATTDKDGKAVVKDLPLGKYEIVETTAPEGYVLNKEVKEVTFEYQGQENSVVKEEVTFFNERQKVQIEVEKQDVENGNVLEGAVFGLYNKTDIMYGDAVIVKADTLLEEAKSNDQGIASFTLDVPLEQYYVKETNAPAGYLLSSDVVEMDASYQGQDVKTIYLSGTVKNEPTTVEITKSDITNGTELDGAKLTVLDKAGNVIDTWISVKEEPHVIKGLTVGETYTLREEFAPYGYLRATDITFTVEETADVQKVEMKDEVPVGAIYISKKGEFLQGVTILDKLEGIMGTIFEYFTVGVSTVTFEVYALEDIKAADGVSGDYYKANELVATVTTDETGIAKAENLPLGKYYVVETKTTNGFVLDAELKEADLSYVDQETKIVFAGMEVTNERQRVKISIVKKDAETGATLAGAEFRLFAKEDILNNASQVVMTADTVIETSVTDKEGKVTFLSDLPLGRYYVKETKAPEGYVKTEEVFDIDASYKGENVPVIEFEKEFVNYPIKLDISKTDITGENELPGAKLSILDENGNVVDSWVSTNEEHRIERILVGKYTLREETAPYGYKIANDIVFEVAETVEVQKVTMKDELVKGKILIKKTDKVTGKGIEGVEFEIRDKDGKVIETLVTDKKGRAESKELDIATFENGAYVADIKYYVVETKAAKGYVLDETPHEVKLRYKGTAPDTVTYTLEITNSPVAKKGPKTGDETPFGLYAALAGMSFFAGMAVLLKKKREE